MGDEQGPAPAFPGQRPPFQPGHTVSTTHGARSPRVVEPLAAQILAEHEALDDWPDYLRAPSYAAAVRAWAHAEAVAELLRRHLDRLGIDDALASTSESETSETHGKGRSRSRTTARQVQSVLDRLDRAEAHAARCRQRLGLDPLSRARLGRDVATTRAADVAVWLSEQREQRGAVDAQAAGELPPAQPPQPPAAGPSAAQPHTSAGPSRPADT